MTAVWKDVRYGARLLARSPGFTLVAVFSLTLGIGANSAVFSIVNAVLWRRLPVPEPDRLMALYTGESDSPYGPSSYPDYADFRDESRSFSGLAAHNPVFLAYSEGQQTELILGEIVSGNYFSVLGVPAAHGRTLLSGDDRVPGEAPVAVISHSFWQKRFAGNPAVVGQAIRLNGREFTVVGIAPEAFKGLSVGLAADVWVPMMMQSQVMPERAGQLDRRNAHWLLITGRLKPGVTLGQARSEMGTLARRLEQQFPDSNRDRGVSLVPADQVAVHPAVDGALLGAAGLLMVVVGLVLCIASANIANLLLVRASARRREIAMRLAIGASHGQLVRQLLIESLLLALLGGAAGLLLAYWTIRLLVTFQPSMPVAISLNVGLNGQVLLFTLVVAVLTGLLCGLAPALRVRQPALVADLKGQATEEPRRRFALRNLLVVVQVAVSLLLLIAAGLFLRSLGKAQSVNPGFRTHGLLIASFQLGLSGYSEPRARAFSEQILERARALPSVRSAALTDWVPLSLGLRSRAIFIEGRPAERKGRGVEIDSALVDPAYFRTLGIGLLEGREFDSHDRPGSPDVAVVNQAMARRFWPGESPIGKQFSTVGISGPFLQVVGVVRDGKYRTLGEEPRAYFYLPLEQSSSPSLSLIVQTEGNVRDTAAALREAVRTFDPGLSIFEMKTIEEHLTVSLFPARMAALLLSAFGLVGLLLASVGLYGVVSSSVSRRTREIGIRMALGAEEGSVLRLVIFDSMILVAVGLALGLGAALLSSRILAGQLYGISTVDPVTFTGIPLMLTGVALLASYIPARRAVRVDPMVVLRRDY
jgi:predicted permease